MSKKNLDHVLIPNPSAERDVARPSATSKKQDSPQVAPLGSLLTMSTIQRAPLFAATCSSQHADAHLGLRDATRAVKISPPFRDV